MCWSKALPFPIEERMQRHGSARLPPSVMLPWLSGSFALPCGEEVLGVDGFS